MERLHFRLQPALECARKNETLARRVVVDARLAFDDVCGLLAAVESRISELRAPAGVPAETIAGSFAAVEAAAIALGALRRRRRSEARHARALLERAREVYARASAQRRGLERLRERRLLEFNVLAEAAETAAADDANALRANEREAARTNPFEEAEDAPPGGRASENPSERDGLRDEAERTALRKFTP